MDTITTLAGLLFVVLSLEYASAGICWLNKSRSRHGRCQQMIALNITRAKCCSRPLDTVSWSPHVFTPRRVFLFAISQSAEGCHRCHKSCDTVTCGTGKRCRLKHGHPRCVCSPKCSRKHLTHKGRVCGSDGATYRNACRILRHNCRRDENVELGYYGACQTSCSKVECLDGRTCLEDQNGMPHCAECPSRCPTVVSIVRDNTPLCGSDGITYPSSCQFHRAACLAGGKFRIAYMGACVDNATCEDIRCSQGFICLTDRATGQPSCVSCTNHGYCLSRYRRLTICGSDNVTYPSYCELRNAMCRIGRMVYTKHRGECKSDDG